MSKFQRSWMLFKSSMQVIAQNKKLLLFPILILLLTGVITLFFLTPVALWSTGHSYTEAAHWKTMAHRWFTWDEKPHQGYVNPAGFALLAALYLLSMLTATFSNVAFFSQILSALRGQPVSMRGGLRVAAARFKTILLWSLFAGLVGLAIKALEERVGIIGRWIVRLIGIAWSVACVFVIPAIVCEERSASPVGFLKTSAGVLRKTWGEALIGYAGVRFGGLLVFLGSLLWLGAAFVLAIVLNNGWIIAGAFLPWFLFLIVYGYLIHVASQVYLGALYIYATEGAAPGPFNTEQMQMAWKVKSNPNNVTRK